MKNGISLWKMFQKIYGLLCLAFVTAGLVSCNDDDDAIDSAPISVLQVYLEDAEATVKDRPVEICPPWPDHTHIRFWIQRHAEGIHQRL